VKSTEGKHGEAGLLRIDFPGYSGKGSLEEITWEEFFEKFEEAKLALVYQEETAESLSTKLERSRSLRCEKRKVNTSPDGSNSDDAGAEIPSVPEAIRGESPNDASVPISAQPVGWLQRTRKIFGSGLICADVTRELSFRTFERGGALNDLAILTVVAPQSVLQLEQFVGVKGFQVALENRTDIVRVNISSPAIA